MIAMSKEKQEGSVPDLFGGGADSDVTSQQIVQKLGEIDENLAMKADIKFVGDMTILDVCAVSVDSRGNKPRTTKLLQKLAEAFRVNSVSHDRKGRKEAFEAFKSLYLEEVNLRDKANEIFGAGRK